MAIISYKLSTRGRPRQIDTTLIYKSIMENLKEANQRLYKISKESKGVRGEQFFGSPTSLPDWIDETLDILKANEYGRDISPSEAESIRATEKAVKELASRTKKVYSRAIADVLTESYFKDLESHVLTGSKFERKRIINIKSMVSKLSKVERQNLLLSKAFQEPGTAKGKYKHVLKWAQDKTGKANMTYEEAWTYLLQDRIRKHLKITGKQASKKL